jgi:hypothetical protein
MPISFVFFPLLFSISLFILSFYFLLILIFSTIQNNSLKAGFLSIPAAFIQLFAYGLGFISEIFKTKLQA